jgi:large repetitive protein
VASYGGDAGFNPSGSAALTETITKAATATAVTGGPSGVPGFVMFTATVTVVAPGGGTPTGTVTFFDGAASLGAMTLDAGGQASLTTNTLSPGTHTIKARYDGDGNFTVSTSPSFMFIP